ncbi:MAG: XRE family transcriptional regulator [Specibacter sp.]
MYKPPFISARLTHARRRRGLTITALSTLGGVSTKSISDYENGKKDPSTETLVRLAHALHVPIEHFARPSIEEVPADAVSFRAPSKMTARNRDMALTVSGHAIELRRWIEERYDLPQVDVPTLHKFVGAPDASAAAEILRAKWGLGQAPLGNMIHLLELHGIAVYSAKADNGEMDAFSFRDAGTPYVLLSTKKSAERGRFDAAHELGHLVLHAESAKPSGIEAEREADSFASSFLMPEADVRAQVRLNPSLEEILKKKRRWNVSAMALAYRLHDLDLLSDWLYHTTCVNLSRMGYRSGEPNGVERESSRLLTQVVNDLWGTPRGFENLCRDLAVTPEDVNDLIFKLAPIGLTGSSQSSPPVRPNLRIVTD